MASLCTDKDLSKYLPTQCILFHYFHTSSKKKLIVSSGKLPKGVGNSVQVGNSVTDTSR